ncbi:uncharacterized protein LOC125061150 [Pieris napi]|uniref:uncharacterized protein LOC125061150 n=1 Tax=Pieris napi TaxID=78633 RepID=UPI001FBB3C21|nr:uncharacterized protein LOC125061150 [Pieris napi]XP_047522332.1 uncharacterized protein LOC125061150 [Pieris napi]
MWQEPMKDSLLLDCPTDPVSQNFNPYEVLEPQKVDLKDRILVDLTPVEEKQPDANLEMGSFLDTITKTDYNLVDLYQNIYVTPQHLQKTPTHIDKNSLIDFGNYVDKQEVKNIENNNVTASLDKTDKPSFDEFIHQTVPSHSTSDVNETTEENAIKNNLDATFDALYRSCITKLDTSIPENSEFSLFNNFKFSTLKNDPPIVTETPKAEKGGTADLKNDYFYMTNQTKDHSKDISHQNNLTDCPSVKSDPSHLQLTDSMRRNILDEVKREEIPIKCKCYYAKNILNLNKSIDASFINPFDNDLPVTHSKDLKKPKALSMLSNNQFTQIKSGQLLQTVVKDQKLYAKQMKLKENNQNLTKGPDIYEKSIILPQIMERLAARKKILDDQRDWKRRLVLDSGESKINEDIPCVKTEILMADCNKERLANLKIRTSFENFIKTGSPK